MKTFVPTKVKKVSFSRKRRGISPILATIILIVITVVVGAMLYGFVTGFFSSSATSMNANVQTNLIIPSGSNAATWSVTIKNAGTVNIKSIAVTLYNASNKAMSIISYPSAYVSPGQEVTISQIGSTLTSPTGAILENTTIVNGAPAVTILSNYNVVSGSSYNYQVVLTFANGASKTISGAVTASSF